MGNVSELFSKYSQQRELSALLESDKFGIYAADTYLALDGIADDYAELYALINTTINGADAEIWFKNGTCLIGTSIAIPSNVKLVFLNGGMLKPESGVTITGSNAKVEAGLTQIFDLTDGGSLAGTWDIKEIYPQWFGAKGDNSTDDTVAFQKCIDMSIKIKIPEGTYILKPVSGNYGNFALNSFDKTPIIEGSGIGKTILKLVRTASETLDLLAVTTCHIRNLSIDGGFNKATMTKDEGAVISANGDCTIESCHIYNAMGSCITSTGDNIRILNCKLEKFGDHAIYVSGNLTETQEGDVASSSDNILWQGNTVIEDITYHNGTDGTEKGALKIRDNVSNIRVVNNSIDGHISIIVSADNRSDNGQPRGLVIANNDIHSSYAGVYLSNGTRYSWVDGGARLKGVEISNNYFSADGVITGAGVVMTLAGANVVGNIFKTIKGYSELGNGDTGIPSIFANNIFLGINGTGIFKPATGSIIVNNIFKECGTGLYENFKCSIKGNTFDACTAYGLRLNSGSSSTDMTIVQCNTFKANAVGVSYESACTECAVISNLFLNNTVSFAIARAIDYNEYIYDNQILGGGAFPTQATDTNALALSARKFKTDGISSQVPSLGVDIFGVKMFGTSQIGVANTAAATTLGSVAKKLPIYDDSKNLLGYIPIYDGIT